MKGLQALCARLLLLLLLLFLYTIPLLLLLPLLLLFLYCAIIITIRWHRDALGDSKPGGEVLSRDATRATGFDLQAERQRNAGAAGTSNSRSHSGDVCKTITGSLRFNQVGGTGDTLRRLDEDRSDESFAGGESPNSEP